MWALVWPEIRRRWRAAAAVGVLFGFGFALALAGAAGARRTETAFSRMVAATEAAELLVSAATEDEALRRGFYDRLAALDGVDGVGHAVAVPLVPVQVPRGEGTALTGCAHLSADGRFGYEIHRPNVLQGRLPRRDRSDEILINPAYAQTFGVAVGDELHLTMPSPDERPIAGRRPASDAPVARTRIVGLGVFSAEVVPVSDLDRAPRAFASPAFANRYTPSQERQCYDALFVRLTPGADFDRVAADIERVGGPAGPFIQNLSANYSDVRRAIEPQARALWLFAAAVAAGTLLVGGQLLGRQLQESTSRATPVWRALGATRPVVRVLVAAPSVVAALVGAMIALTGALLLSGRFPIGPARLAEPDRGPELHLGIHIAGALVALALPLVIGVATAFVATRLRTHAPHVGRLAWFRSATSSPALLVGIDLATDSRRGEGAVPVRSATAGVSLAVAAAVATIMFAGALDALVSEPERYGRDWDLMMDGEFAPTPVAAALDELGDHPAVAAIAGGRWGEVTIDGVRVPTVGLADLVGRTFPALTEGAVPRGEDEIVVGKRSLTELGRSIGDVVSVDTGTGPRPMRVVGVVAFPRINRGSFTILGLGVGAMTRPEAFPPYDAENLAQIQATLNPSDFVGPGGATYEFLTIRMRSNVARQARDEVLAIAQQIADTNHNVLRTEQRPIAIDNYAAVRSTPVILAVLLGSMAAATLLHLVVVVVRRRRRDLAVCSALGMQRSQLSYAVIVHAVLVAGLAMLVGIPLGIAGGRLAWANFASNLGVIETLRLPLLGIGITSVLTVAVAVAVSVMPAINATRALRAVVLRRE